MMSFLACAGTICGAAAIAAKWQDELLKAYRDIQTKQDKKRLSKALECFSFSKTFGDALESFGACSDAFFGKRLFSLRSLTRSAAISIALLIFLVSISVYVNLHHGNLSSAIATGPVVHSFTLLILISVSIDYISVSATRWLISVARTKSSGFKIFVFFADFALSAVIFFLVFVPAKLVIFGVTGKELLSWLRKPIGFLLTEMQPWMHLTQIPMYLSVVHDVRFAIGPNGTPIPIDPIETAISYAYPESAAFFSSMLTSIWLWLYLLAWLATCVTSRLEIIKKLAVKHANVKLDPIAVLSFWLRLTIYGLAVVLIVALAILDFFA